MMSTTSREPCFWTWNLEQLSALSSHYILVLVVLICSNHCPFALSLVLFRSLPHLPCVFGCRVQRIDSRKDRERFEKIQVSSKAEVINVIQTSEYAESLVWIFWNLVDMFFMICVYMFVAFMECEWMWRVAECDYMDDSLERLCTPKRTIHLCQGGSMSPFFVNHRESCACLESIPFGAILQAYWGYTILKTSLSPKMVVVLGTTGRKAINFYKFQRMSQGTEARWFNFYIGVFIFSQGNLCHEGLQTGSSHSTCSMIKYDKVW